MMAETTGKKYDFIILTRTPWHEIPRSRHQFTQALSEHYTCLFVEANTNGCFFSTQFETVSDRITILQNQWPIPYKMRYRVPWFSNRYYGRIRQAIEATCDTRNSIWITFDHTSIACNAHYEKSIYYATDDHTRSGAKKWNFFLKGQWAQEKALLRHCALTMVTANDLFEKFHAHARSLMHLALAGPLITQSPKPIQHKPKKRVAFLAAFNSQRVPVQIVKALAADDELELLCIGPVKSDFRQALESFPQVQFTGPKTGDELYTLLRSCDVGIAPYRTESVNSGVTPSKLWQYLACGLPVVVTRLPSMSGMPVDETLISFCDQPFDFVGIVKQAIASDTDELRTKRWQWSQTQTWQARIETFVDACRSRNLLT
jgi:glycosyltransferase involved in cell wall biosynthesis